MRRILNLTLIALVLVSLSGCRGWPRWLSRGDNCGMCDTYGTTGPSMLAPSYTLPAGEQLLPGPTAPVPAG